MLKTLPTFQNVDINQCKHMLNVENMIVEEKNILHFGVNPVLDNHHGGYFVSPTDSWLRYSDTV